VKETAMTDKSDKNVKVSAGRVEPRHSESTVTPLVDIYEQQDSARCLPGETGVIDLKSFLGTLKKIGYQGAVTPEPMSAKLRQMASAEAAMAAGAAMKKVWEEAGV